MNGWENAFGAAPETFEKSVRSALNRVKASDAAGHAPVRRPKLRALLIAACILLFATTAYAAAEHFGVLAFFQKSGKQVPKEAQSLVETNIPQKTVDTEFVKFSVREAVYSAGQFYVVVEARPADAKKYLLLGTDVRPDDPVGNEGITDTGTFRELAKRDGKRMLNVNASIRQNGTPVDGSMDYVLEADGTFVMMLSGKVEGAGPQTLECVTIVAPYDEKGELVTAGMQRASFPFTLTSAPAGDTAAYTQEKPVVVKDTGVVVENVRLTQSKLEILAELTFFIDASATKEEKARAADGLWFEYIDENGKGLADGLAGSGSIESLGGVRFVQKTSLAAMDGLPDTITDRAYDCWDNTRYGTAALRK